MLQSEPRARKSIESEAFHRTEKNSPCQLRSANIWLRRVGMLICLIVAFELTLGAGFAGPNTEPESVIRALWNELVRISYEEGAAPLLDGEIRRLMSDSLGGRWSSIDRGAQHSLVAAVILAARRGLRDRQWLSVTGDDLEIEELSRGQDHARLRLVLPERHASSADLQVRLERSNETWRLDWVRLSGESLDKRLTGEVREVMGRYGLEQLIADLRGADSVLLEDFEALHSGQSPPRGWRARYFAADAGNPYRLAAEKGERFLRAEASGENVMLYREIRWNIEDFPILGWRWRIRKIPEGADERVESRADNAAGVYLSFRRKWGLVPETVKFVFSDVLEPGAAFRRGGIGMPWTVVVDSEAVEVDPTQWRQITVDVREIYRRTFGGEPGDRAIGLAVLTDANSVGGESAADYDDFVAYRLHVDLPGPLLEVRRPRE